MTDIITPVGRLVQGSPFKANDKDMDGNPLRDKAGNQRYQYFIALAVEKTNPEIKEFIALINKTAAEAWPRGEYKSSDFAWKIIDGDSAKAKDKVGFAGCYVFRFTSGFAPTCWTRGGVNKITDEKAIKRGDYVRVAGTVVGNDSKKKPGVYLNMAKVEHVGYGEEIVGVNDSGEAFAKSAPSYTPAGMSTTPVVPTQAGGGFAFGATPEATTTTTQVEPDFAFLGGQ